MNLTDIKAAYISPEVHVMELVPDGIMVDTSGSFKDYNEDDFDWEN